MNIFEAAQPALLYIVPGLLLTTFIRAVFAGEVRKVFYFDENVGSVSGEIAVESSQHED
jgi:minor histocompatibility antigen H13